VKKRRNEVKKVMKKTIREGGKTRDRRALGPRSPRSEESTGASRLRVGPRVSENSCLDGFF
jgi:hypothetical protein